MNGLVSVSHSLGHLLEVTSGATWKQGSSVTESARFCPCYAGVSSAGARRERSGGDLLFEDRRSRVLKDHAWWCRHAHVAIVRGSGPATSTPSIPSRSKPLAAIRPPRRRVVAALIGPFVRRSPVRDCSIRSPWRDHHSTSTQSMCGQPWKEYHTPRRSTFNSRDPAAISIVITLTGMSIRLHCPVALLLCIIGHPRKSAECWQALSSIATTWMPKSA